MFCHSNEENIQEKKYLTETKVLDKYRFFRINKISTLKNEKF